MAALTWYAGAVILLFKGVSLVREARAISSHGVWLWPAAAGVAAGLVKSKFIFERSCRKNLRRIDGLVRRRPWLFFRPRFFVLLCVMIITGATLSRLAHGNYPFLLAVAGLDLALATALLTSSRVYWMEKAFVRRPGKGAE